MGRNIDIPSVSDFDSPTGKGALGVVEDRRVTLGNARFLAESGVDTAPLAAQADQLRADGATAIFMGLDSRVAGVFAIADPIKPTTPEALAALRADGIKVVMLTGDNRTTADAVARQPGIDAVEADVLPGQKAAVVARLKQEERIVAMAGDGVKEAPALATAVAGREIGRASCGGRGVR